MNIQSSTEAAPAFREAFMQMVRDASHSLGKKVCAKRGCNFFYPGGEINSWSAYICVRCGAFSRDLETLPYAPDEDEFGYDDSRFDIEYQERIDKELAFEKRWISWLPFPRWA